MQGRSLPGWVAVKLHSGEPGGNNYPAPALIKDLVQAVDGTNVECNTAYPGRRFTTEQHLVALESVQADRCASTRIAVMTRP